MSLVIGPKSHFGSDLIKSYKRGNCTFDLYDTKVFCCGIFISALVSTECKRELIIRNSNEQFLLKLPEREKAIDIGISPYSSVIFVLSNVNNCYCWFFPSKSLVRLIIDDDVDVSIDKISIADDILVILNKNGLVFVTNIKEIDSNNFITKSIPLKNKIVNVSCGNEHTILLAENGNILTFGSGSKGQLGHGSTTLVDKPLIIEALDGVKMIKISAGGWHSAALSDSGDLYLWGWNNFGQLALGNLILTAFLPAIISLNGDDYVSFTNVSCGICHTVAQTDDGICWGWGWNGYKQLAADDQEKIWYPFRISLPQEFGDPKKIDAQHWSTIFSL